MDKGFIVKEHWGTSYLVSEGCNQIYRAYTIPT